MADDWELAHGLNPNSAADASLDADGDGQTNYQEFLAGTDPTNAQDVLRLQSALANANTVQLTFASAPGRNYRIEYKNNLSSLGWTALRDLTGTGSLLSLQDSLPAGTLLRFYHLHLLP